MKPYYQNDLVTLYHGDCLDVMPLLETQFDAIITDPPYGTTSCRWDSVIPFPQMWEQVKRLIKHRGAVLLFGAEPFSSSLRLSNIDWFKYDWVWCKSYSVGFVNAHLKPMNRHEIISVFSDGKVSNCNENNMFYYPQGLIEFNKHSQNGNRAKKENTYWRPSQEKYKQGKLIETGDNDDALEFAKTWNSLTGNRNGETGDYVHGTMKKPSHFSEKDGDKAIHTENYYIQQYTNYPDTVLNQFRKEGHLIHPTQKPVALLEYLIRTYTKPNETVLDFCAGSGTTGIACMNTNRKCVLIEKEEKYCKVISERLEHHQVQNELWTA